MYIFLKTVFSVIRSQEMSSSCFPPEAKLLIGRPTRPAIQRPVFWQETTWTHVLTWISEKWHFFWKQTLINKTLARKREKLTRCFFDFRRFFCSTLIWKVRKFIIVGAWLEDYFNTETLTQMRRATNTNIFF